MSNEVVMVLGYPASGKSTFSQELIKKDYVYLNRDQQGGIVADLLPKLDSTLKTGSNVVLDNLFAKIESRKPFIDICKQHNVPIRCIHVNTSIEDAQINALTRMHKKHKKFFFSPDDLKGVKDPNMFPVVVLFKYRKEFEKPTLAEGFSTIETINFTRLPRNGYNNKALICDYDDTLRRTISKQKYPFEPSDVEILPGRREKLTEYKNNGYILLGCSNQSGIHKGKEFIGKSTKEPYLTMEKAIACFERTNELLGHKIDYKFCPHQSTPPNCYCRKPQSGLAVYFIEKYKLDPSQCLFIGDRGTDKTWAERVGFQYFHPDEFFV